jgi:AhpC/TSA family
MITTLCLLSSVLVPGQRADRLLPPPPPVLLSGGRGSTWQLSPQLTRAQELLYRGSFREEANGGRVQFTRSYRIEIRAFVLDTSSKDSEVALLTLLKARDLQTTAVPARPVNSDQTSTLARLEVVRVNTSGSVLAEPGVPMTVPLDGAPTLEHGLFVPAPRERIGTEQDWQTSDPGLPSRPPQTWRIVGIEMVNGTSCVKVVGTQQSDDWDRPRADRSSWRRTDTVWVAPRIGYASRVERVIEQREPARKEATQRSVLRYDLESSLQYPGALYDNRRQEITQARAFADSAAPLLPAAQKHEQQLNVLLTKIAYHLDRQAPTPFREAVLQVKRRIEAARRGEAPLPLPGETSHEQPVATTGQPAPDFVANQYGVPESARLRNWRGRPIVLVFYNPHSQTADNLLGYTQQVSNSYGNRLTVAAASVVEDADVILKQQSLLKLTFPILNGSGLRSSYDVETTPKIFVIDGNGLVRGICLGWGHETAAEVNESLKQCLPEAPPRPPSR